MKGMALQVKDGKGESVNGCYLVLLPTPSGMARHCHLTVHEMLYLIGCTVFAHLTDHDLVGCTMFARDGKRRRPQYCLCSDASSWFYRVCLTCPDDTVLQVRRAWQGMVIGIAVDLSALPYLLCLFPGPTLSGRP